MRTRTTRLAAGSLAGVCVLALCVIGPSGTAGGGPRTWRVGPDRSLTVPSEAAAVARDGDTVLIDAGTYVGDVATWTQDDLTLRGAGGRARLEAGGQSAQGKAIWVIAGDHTVVDRIEFSGATVPDGNGAGIRQEGAGVTVTRSWFHHNQDGILTGANAASDIVIRRSRFFRNGGGDGYTHNIYVGAVRSLTVTGSYLWGADVGHELKSRAASNTVVGNRISDGDATASYSIDLPNGGRSLIAGNTIIQGPSSENSTLVSYGAEMGESKGSCKRAALGAALARRGSDVVLDRPTSDRNAASVDAERRAACAPLDSVIEGLSHDSRLLWVVNNTFVNRRSTGTFVGLADGSRAHLRNNLLVGPGDLTNLPGVQARANRRVGSTGFVDPGSDDYRLRARSPAIDRGRSVPRRWRARWEYVHPAGQARRERRGRLDLGAFER